MKNGYPDNKRHCIVVCNALLRGELSAVETYTQVIDRFGGFEPVERLAKIRAEHQRSAELLRRSVLAMGGAPVRGSGAWGTFTRALQGTADLIGEVAALHTLIEGERYGCGRYSQALVDERMLPASRGLIREQLLPRTGEHVASLKALCRSL